MVMASVMTATHARTILRTTSDSDGVCGDVGQLPLHAEFNAQTDTDLRRIAATLCDSVLPTTPLNDTDVRRRVWGCG